MIQASASFNFDADDQEAATAAVAAMTFPPGAEVTLHVENPEAAVTQRTMEHIGTATAGDDGAVAFDA